MTIAALALTTAACSTHGETATTSATGVASSGAAATGSYSYSAAADPLPTPDQIHIGIKILQKQCFNFAGCNITYQIDPHHSGVGVLHPVQRMMVIYEVSGADSGPIINNFTVDTDGTLYVRRQEFVSTRTQPVTLTARAISVSAAN